MSTTAFESRPLPASVRQRLRTQLDAAHRLEPLGAVDVRRTAARVADIATGLGLSTTVFRGALDLHGGEVDHVWLAVADPDATGAELVLDAAFPLFVERFVDVLRHVVAGDLPVAALDEAAATAGVDERVLGVFPRRVRYRGRPVWAARHP